MNPRRHARTITAVALAAVATAGALLATGATASAQDRLDGLARLGPGTTGMHDRMTRQGPGMTGMHQHMSDGNPGRQQMHELMTDGGR